MGGKRSFIRLKQRRSVDFPHPEGPMIAVMRRSGMASETPSRARCVPYQSERLLVLIAAGWCAPTAASVWGSTRESAVTGSSSRLCSTNVSRDLGNDPVSAERSPSVRVRSSLVGVWNECAAIARKQYAKIAPVPTTSRLQLCYGPYSHAESPLDHRVILYT